MCHTGNDATVRDGMTGGVGNAHDANVRDGKTRGVGKVHDATVGDGMTVGVGEQKLRARLYNAPRSRMCIRST